MGKTIVNNNIKLKSGGGVINDATDGLSVESGTTANKLVRLDSSAKLPAISGENLTSIRNIYASDTVVFSALTERTITGGGYTKVKEIKINCTGTFRVKFDGKYVGSTSGYARVYKNDSGLRTERLLTKNAYSTYSEDLAVTAGDLIQLYGSNSSGQGTTYLKNFIICFDTLSGIGVVNID